MAVFSSGFQINDLVLDIPPKNIKTNKQSFNHNWETLRTRSSVKSKSGFATLEIFIEVEFTDDPSLDANTSGIKNGYDKLRNLVSQFRVTPFCYVENEYLRNILLGGASDKNMALALKQLEIIKSNEDTNVITALFHFCWFNYLPFTRTFSFKKDIFSSVETNDPAESNAWKLMYKAEQLRNPYKEITRLRTSMVAEFSQYGTVTTKRYAQLEKEVGALSALKDKLETLTPSSEGHLVVNAIEDIFSKELGDTKWARALRRELFGDTTSMAYEETSANILGRIKDVVRQNLDPDYGRYSFVTDQDSWKVVFLKDGKPLVLPGELTKQRSVSGSDSEQFDGEESVVLTRKRRLDFNELGLVVTGISISFENVLAVLPLTGYTYPTYQHIGSADARVTISIETTEDDAVSVLSKFYASLDEQSRLYRQLPAGHRNLEIGNDLINMCGLRYFLPEALSSATIEGEPGSSVMGLELVDNPITPESSEELTTGQSFTSSIYLRSEVSKILERNLALIPNALSGAGGNIKLRELVEISPVAPVVVPTTIGKGFIVADLPERTKLNGYYTYKGKDQAGRNDKFKSLCLDYGQKLGDMFATLATMLLGYGKGDYSKDRAKALAANLLLLKNYEVISIERLNEDLSPAYSFVRNTKSVERTEPLAGAFLGPEKGFAATGKQPLEREGNIVQEFDSELIIDSYNTAQETRATIDPNQSIGDIEQLSPGEVLSGFKSTRQIQLQGLINSTFARWLDFSREFLDAILGDPSVLALDEFSTVRNLIEKSRGALTGSNAHRDFPLPEVLSLMQQSKDNTTATMYSKLLQMYNDLGIAAKNVGISALLEPDFYFFNPQNDIIDEIIPYNVINKAKEAVLASRRDMFAAEKDWFLNHYETNYLGKDLADSINATALAVDIASLSKDVGQSLEKTASLYKDAGLSWKTNFDYWMKVYRLAAPDFVGECASSITQSIIDGQTIKAPEITRGQDEQNIYNHYHGDLALQSPDVKVTVRHQFDDVNVLEFLPASFYQEQPFIPDPNKQPHFITPTPTWARRVTSEFASARAEINGGPHFGIDIAADNPANSLGTPIHAAEDGMITHVTKDYTIQDETREEYENRLTLAGKGTAKTVNEDILKKKVDTTVSIEITHGAGYKTLYKHLQWDPTYVQAYSAILHRGGELGLSREDQRKRLSIKKGQKIGLMGNTGYSSGPHLHFEIRHNGVAQPPRKFLGDKLLGGETPSQGPITGIDTNNESILVKSVQQFTKTLKTKSGYGMNRAYPTFKLYFIESDLGERRRYAFDDFFSYSAVRDITVVKSRKIASDLCIINLTNISGVLSNRDFARQTKEELEKRQNVSTVEENPLSSIMLQTGTHVQVRLGYSNNPQELTVVFNGTIVDYEFSSTGDLVTIVCQSFANELVQTIQGESKTFGGWFSQGGRTAEILRQLMTFPEVVHFGHWEGGKIGANSQYGLLQDRWNFIPRPGEDNLWPPQGKQELGFLDLLASPFVVARGTSKYIMYNTTIWDVFQEMTLRHPGFITRAVPYEGKGGPRMTMFFGLPNQLYFARDASLEEDNVVAQLKKIVDYGYIDDYSEKIRDKITSSRSGPTSDELNSALNDVPEFGASAQEQEAWIRRTAKTYGLNRGFVKPFKSYHVATSALNILYNSISNTSHNTFNMATVQYSGSYAAKDTEDGDLNFGNPKTLSLKADAGIPDEGIREVFLGYPNCSGYEMAKRYAVGSLFNSLKESYSGSLILTGNPDIDPYSTVYVFDEYNDMFGPVEVEQVVHKFSRENGFISEITPDLVVHVNETVTLSTGDAMGLIAEYGLKKIGMESISSFNDTAASKAASAILLPLTIGQRAIVSTANLFYGKDESALGLPVDNSFAGLVGVFIFRKLITRTQLAHPFRFSPLVLNGKPMTGGLPNRYTDGNFIQGIGKWVKDFQKNTPLYLEDIYDRIHPNNWLGHSQGDFRTFLFGSKGQRE